MKSNRMSLLSSNPGPRSENSRSAQWADCRRRDRLFWTVCLTFLPANLVIGSILSRLPHSDIAIGVLGVMWMLAFATTHLYRISWKCPRCHKPFFYRTVYLNIFAEKCVHCRLPKYRPPRPPSNKRVT